MGAVQMLSLFCWGCTLLRVFGLVSTCIPVERKTKYPIQEDWACNWVAKETEEYTALSASIRDAGEEIEDATSFASWSC